MNQAMSAQYTAGRVIWRNVAMLLIVAVVAHQFVMMAPQIHEHMMPAPAAVADTSVMPPNQCSGGCSTPVVRLCSAIEAILPAASLVALSLMAILVMLAVSVLLCATTATVAEWRWPPDRHRALLQVFRC